MRTIKEERAMKGFSSSDNLNTKRVETSKVILIVLGVIFLTLTVLGVLYAWIMGNDSVIVILSGGVVSFITVAVGFYYWKARAENVIKLRGIYGREEFYGIMSDMEDEGDKPTI